MKEKIDELIAELNDKTDIYQGERTSASKINEGMFKQRKELLSFIFKNQSKMVLFTTAITDMLSKMVVHNDTPSHPQLISLMQELSDQAKWSPVLQNRTNLDISRKHILNDSVLVNSPSVLESYSSNSAYESKRQTHTFGQPKSSLLRGRKSVV